MDYINPLQNTEIVSVKNLDNEGATLSRKNQINSLEKIIVMNKETRVSRTLSSVTLSWEVPTGILGTQVSLGWGNSIGNSVTSGALPSGYIDASITGSYDASTLRNMLQTFRARVKKVNYECKQDVSQLNEPILINEAVAQTTSNVAYYDPAKDRSNTENVPTLQTVFTDFEMNLFNSILIGATQSDVDVKIVTLTLNFEQFLAYGDITTISVDGGKCAC